MVVERVRECAARQGERTGIFEPAKTGIAVAFQITVWR
jgi:hypothetical protein